MTNFDEDELPTDLSELGRRMRDERPRADEDAVVRMQARALRPRRASRRTHRRSFAASLSIFVAMMTVSAATASAMLGGLPIVGGILPPISIPPISLPGITLPGITVIPPPPPPAPAGGGAPAPAAPALALPVAPTVAELVAPIVSGGLRPGPASTAGSKVATSSRIAPAIAAKVHPNAGNRQYTLPGLVCRIIRFIFSRRIARLLGC